MRTLPMLAQSLVTAESSSPRGFILFLHGILGSGNNWRAIARRFVAARPELGAVLVDLRLHGGSLIASPPHTVDAAARDLHAVADALGGPVVGVLGHSFGGKVALAYVEQRPTGLENAWIIDSAPSAREDARGSEDVLRVLDALQDLPPLPSRAAFLAHLRAHGFGRVFSEWLATSLRRRDDGFVLRLDIPAIRTLLSDYLARDQWPIVEHPPGDVCVHLVVAGKSTIFGAAERARAAQVADRSARRVTVHTLENADHWVHVDDPAGVLRVLVETA